MITIEAQVPSCLLDILSRFAAPVFGARPALLPPLPLVMVSDADAGNEQARVIGSAVLVLIPAAVRDSETGGNAWRLAVESFMLFPPHRALHVFCKQQEPRVPSCETLQLLSRLVLPRSTLHLPTARPVDARQPMSFCFVVDTLSHPLTPATTTIAAHCKTISISALAESSLRPWCEALEAAVTAGRRFAPILRSAWEWSDKSSQEAPSSLSLASAVATTEQPRTLQFRSKESTNNNTDEQQQQHQQQQQQSSLLVDLMLPVGSGCSSAVACRSANLRSDGLPMDWVLSSLSSNVELLSQLFSLPPVPSSNKDSSADVMSTVSLPFDPDRIVKPLWHIKNSNRYVSSAPTADSASASTHLSDVKSGIVASIEEASRFRRRTERLRSILLERRIVIGNDREEKECDESDVESLQAASSRTKKNDKQPLVCCLHIGRPHSDAEKLVVDDIPVKSQAEQESDSNDADDDSASALLSAASKLASSLRCSSSSCATIIFFAFNCTPHDFTHTVQSDDGVALLLIHRFVGFADPSASWDSIGHVIARSLPSALKVTTSHQHLR